MAAVRHLLLSTRPVPVPRALSLSGVPRSLTTLRGNTVSYGLTKPY